MGLYCVGFVRVSKQIYSYSFAVKFGLLQLIMNYISFWILRLLWGMWEKEIQGNTGWVIDILIVILRLTYSFNLWRKNRYIARSFKCFIKTDKITLYLSPLTMKNVVEYFLFHIIWHIEKKTIYTTQNPGMVTVK